MIGNSLSVMEELTTYTLTYDRVQCMCVCVCVCVCVHVKGKKLKACFYVFDIQSIEPLKTLYTSVTGRPVHPDTNAASSVSIQLCFSHIFPPLPTVRYSFTLLSEERTKIPKLGNNGRGNSKFEPRAHN